MRLLHIKLWLGSIVTGTIFGLMALIVENTTNVKVYTLLMNVDYIPILKEFSFPVWVEFSYHLMVCLVITYALYLIARHFRWTKRKVLGVSIGVNVIIALLLFPTTALSERTPSWKSIEALSWWVALHAFYGLLVGLFLILMLGAKKYATS